MYLEIVVNSKTHGTISTLIGPFTSKKERESYKKEWQEVLSGYGSLVINRDKITKDMTAFPVEKGYFALALCRIMRDKI